MKVLFLVLMLSSCAMVSSTSHEFDCSGKRQVVKDWNFMQLGSSSAPKCAE